MSKYTSKLHNITIIKDGISEHFLRHKKQYLIAIVLILSAFIVGIIAGFGYQTNINIEKIPDISFRQYLASQINLLGLLFSRIFSFVFVGLIVWLLSCNKWLSYVGLLIFVYFGFVFGNTISILVCLFRLSGVVNALIVYLPCHLLMMISHLALFVVCQHYSFDDCNRHYGILSTDFYYYIKNTLFCSIVLYMLACLFEILLLPLFGSTLIISVV